MDDTDSSVVSYEINRAELFRAYARIMALPRRHPGGSQPPTTICMAAAQCFNLVADAIDRNDPNLPREWLSP